MCWEVGYWPRQYLQSYWKLALLTRASKDEATFCAPWHTVSAKLWHTV
jgi:hypothetical protein